MALTIQTSTAALSAYQNVSARAVQRDEPGAIRQDAAPGVDTVQIARGNAAAAASSTVIADAEMAAQIAHLAAAQIATNVAAALSAQANSSPDTVLGLLR